MYAALYSLQPRIRLTLYNLFYVKYSTKSNFILKRLSISLETLACFYIIGLHIGNTRTRRFASVRVYFVLISLLVMFVSFKFTI